MTRNLKFIGLALVVAFAMSAVAASAASAKEFKSEKAPTTLTGAQEGTDVFHVDFGNVTCSTAKYTGTMTATAQTTVTVSPAYSGCLFAGIGAKVNTNGCKYTFHVTGESGGNPTGTVDVGGCESAAGVQVTVPSTGTPSCIVDVPAQTGRGVITYTPVGTGTTREITLDVNVTGLTYTQTPGTATSPCTATTTSNGTYTGHALVTGENAAGTEHIGIFIS